MGYSFRLSAWVFYMHHPTDRIAHTTAFIKPIVDHWLERIKSQMGPPHERSIRRPITPNCGALAGTNNSPHGSTMKDRSDHPSHDERTYLTTKLHISFTLTLHALLTHVNPFGNLPKIKRSAKISNEFPFLSQSNPRFLNIPGLL